MSNKVDLQVIITAGFGTNRSFLARDFGHMLTNLGFEVDLSRVAVVDSEPPCDVEKGPVLGTNGQYKFVISEHYVGTPINLNPPGGAPARGPMVRPAVPQLIDRNQTSISVLGGPNTGKTTVMDMLCDYLKSKEVSDEQIERIAIGEDYYRTGEELMHNIQQIKPLVRIVIYTRRAFTAVPLDLLLESCDGHEVPKEPTGE